MFGLWWLKYALIAAAIAAVAIWIGILKAEVHHYQGEAEKNKQEYLVYKANAEAMQSVLKESNAAITLKYKQSLIDQYKALDAKNKAIKERIAADEASKHIVLPTSSVELFNSSTTNESTSQDTTTAKPSDVSGASTSEESYTLNELLIVSNDNNTNHTACIKQVHEWQHFWQDYTAGVSKAESVGRSP